MKRCFLSGSSPALPPSRNRIVGDICIHLYKEITSHCTSSRPVGGSRYDSRWKLIIQEYNYIRGQLFNSSPTNLTLFNISETSLQLWYKNKTRTEEVLTLLQGKAPPWILSVAKEKLPKPSTPT